MELYFPTFASGSGSIIVIRFQNFLFSISMQMQRKRAIGSRHYARFTCWARQWAIRGRKVGPWEVVVIMTRSATTNKFLPIIAKLLEWLIISLVVYVYSIIARSFFCIYKTCVSPFLLSVVCKQARRRGALSYFQIIRFDHHRSATVFFGICDNQEQQCRL